MYISHARLRLAQDLRALTRNNITLVTFGFKACADVILAAYKLPFEAAFGADPAVQYVEVTMGVHTM